MKEGSWRGSRRQEGKTCSNNRINFWLGEGELGLKLDGRNSNTRVHRPEFISRSRSHIFGMALRLGTDSVHNLQKVHFEYEGVTNSSQNNNGMKHWWLWAMLLHIRRIDKNCRKPRRRPFLRAHDEARPPVDTLLIKQR